MPAVGQAAYARDQVACAQAAGGAPLQVARPQCAADDRCESAFVSGQLRLRTRPVWAFLVADSSAQIRERRPELTIFEIASPWMTQAELSEIARTMTVESDIQGGWVGTLIHQRDAR